MNAGNSPGDYAEVARKIKGNLDLRQTAVSQAMPSSLDFPCFEARTLNVLLEDTKRAVLS